MLLLVGMVALGVMAHIVWKKSSQVGGKVVSFRVYIFISLSLTHSPVRSFGDG